VPVSSRCERYFLGPRIASAEAEGGAPWRLGEVAQLKLSSGGVESLRRYKQPRWQPG